MPKKTEKNIQTYYQNAIEIINNFINAKSNEFEAVEKLYKLNNSYKTIIAEQDLITYIPRCNYGMATYIDYLANPEECADDIEFMKENWVPSSFC